MSKMNPKRYYSTHDVEKLYGISIKNQWRLRQKNNGPPYLQFMKKGVIKYPIDEFEAWIEENMKN